MLYNVVLVSGIHQHEAAIVYICSLPLESTSHHLPHLIPLRCHRVPGWALYVIQQLPTGHLFYIWQCVCFFLSFFFFLLYNIVLVLPYINMNLPRVYTCSPCWTPLPPPSLYHPSGSSQCTSPKHPVSCIEPGMVIHFLYDIIHVAMPFSQVIPPSPSPIESKRLFYTSVSLLLSHIPGYHYHPSKFHLYALVSCIGVFLSGLLHSVK